MDLSNPPMVDLLILGAGAAGMMAAIACGETALQLNQPRPRITVLEKNRQPGIKVLVCGGGRCNLTNAGDLDFLIAAFGRNGRFLAPSLRHFDNTRLRDWFAARGVPTHEEHDGKIYPDSNQARSVVAALTDRMEELGIVSRAGAAYAATAVAWLADRGLFEVVSANGAVHRARFLLICVGGQSYTRMGGRGDGYRLAAALGHRIVPPRPAIVPLVCQEPWIPGLQGLAVPDVEVRIETAAPLPRLATGKPTPSVNDLLFTHFGLSGPAVLNLSEIVAELLEKMSPVSLRVDFVRCRGPAELHALFRTWHDHQGRKLVKTLVGGIIPQRLAETLCRLAGIGPEHTCAGFTARQMHQLVEWLKGCRFHVYQTRGFKEAMVTAGGVRLDEVDPEALQSRVNPQLYFAGEILDLTGPSGGYNLQMAFSTGRLAGWSIARRIAALLDMYSLPQRRAAWGAGVSPARGSASWGAGVPPARGSALWGAGVSPARGSALWGAGVSPAGGGASWGAGVSPAPGSALWGAGVSPAGGSAGVPPNFPPGQPPAPSATPLRNRPRANTR